MNSRVIMIVAGAAAVAVGVAAFFLTSDADHSASSGDLSQAVVMSGEVPVPPPPPPAPLPELAVDSYPPDRQYRYETWTVVDYWAGVVDAVTSPETPVSPPPGSGIVAGETVTLSGWAGHDHLGMRMSNVILTMCGKVVGTAPVSMTRPDVAKSVHPALKRSGWRVTLAIEHLPVCEDRALRAWAVPPIGPVMYPIHHEFQLLAPQTPAAPTARYVSQAKEVRPETQEPPVPITLKVKASSLRIRLCPSSSCDTAGKVNKGEHQGFVIDELDGWSLLQIGDVTGWASSKYVTPARE